jgi:alpha-glucoside transport system permease protein
MTDQDVRTPDIQEPVVAAEKKPMPAALKWVLIVAAAIIGLIVAVAIFLGLLWVMGYIATTLQWPKLAQGAIAICIFFGAIMLIFGIASLTTGRLSTVLAWTVLLVPALLLLSVGLVYPGIRTIILSFFGDDSTKFVGFKNFTWVFSTGDNRRMLINTVLWLILAPVVSTFLGLMLALLLDRMKRENIPKSLIFMPMAISFVGAGIIWNLVYQFQEANYKDLSDQIGILSYVPMQILKWIYTIFGLGTPHWTPPNWLLWIPWNNFLLITIMVWIQTGFAMVVLSAAIKSVPTEVVEAAELDGATGFRLFARVTVPMIRGTVIVVLTTIMIAALKVFDIVYVMTGGNFGTNVVANEMYAQTFVQFNVGRGSALAVVLFIAIIPIILYNLSQLRKEREVR